MNANVKNRGTTKLQKQPTALNLNIFPTSNLYQTVNTDYNDINYDQYYQKEFIARSKEKLIDHFPMPPKVQILDMPDDLI